MKRAEFDRRVREQGRDPSHFLQMPEDAAVNPEGCWVVTRHVDRWTVHREDRGVKDLRTFADEESAYEYAFRRWVVWDDV